MLRKLSFVRRNKKDADKGKEAEDNNPKSPAPEVDDEGFVKVSAGYDKPSWHTKPAHSSSESEEERVRRPRRITLSIRDAGSTGLNQSSPSPLVMKSLGPPGKSRGRRSGSQIDLAAAAESPPATPDTPASAPADMSSPSQPAGNMPPLAIPMGKVAGWGFPDDDSPWSAATPVGQIQGFDVAKMGFDGSGSWAAFDSPNPNTSNAFPPAPPTQTAPDAFPVSPVTQTAPDAFPRAPAPAHVDHVAPENSAAPLFPTSEPALPAPDAGQHSPRNELVLGIVGSTLPGEPAPMHDATQPPLDPEHNHVTGFAYAPSSGPTALPPHVERSNSTSTASSVPPLIPVPTAGGGASASSISDSPGPAQHRRSRGKSDDGWTTSGSDSARAHPAHTPASAMPPALSAPHSRSAYHSRSAPHSRTTSPPGGRRSPLRTPLDPTSPRDDPWSPDRSVSPNQRSPQRSPRAVPEGLVAGMQWVKLQRPPVRVPPIAGMRALRGVDGTPDRSRVGVANGVGDYGARYGRENGHGAYSPRSVESMRRDGDGSARYSPRSSGASPRSYSGRRPSPTRGSAAAAAGSPNVNGRITSAVDATREWRSVHLSTPPAGLAETADVGTTEMPVDAIKLDGVAPATVEALVRQLTLARRESDQLRQQLRVCQTRLAEVEAEGRVRSDKEEDLFRLMEARNAKLREFYASLVKELNGQRRSSTARRRRRRDRRAQRERERGNESHRSNRSRVDENFSRRSPRVGEETVSSQYDSQQFDSASSPDVHMPSRNGGASSSRYLGGAIDGNILTMLAQRKNLTELVIDGTPLAPSSGSLLQDCIARHPELRVVSLAGTHLGDSGASYVAEGLRAAGGSLEVLDLSRNDLGPASTALLEGLIGPYTRVSVLRLDNNHLGDAGIQSLAHALSGTTTLFELTLSHNGISGKRLMMLARALLRAPLRVMDLSNNEIVNGGAVGLAYLVKECRSLHSLWLRKNNMTSEGAIILANAVQVNDTLCELDLTDNPIEGAGSRELVDAWKAHATSTSPGIQTLSFVRRPLVRRGVAS